MNRNVVLLIVLAALVGTAVYVQKGKQSNLNSAATAIKLREKLLPDLPVDDVRKIHIRDGANQMNLSVVGNQWVVAERSNYPASIDKVKRTLLSLRDLKIVGAKTIKNDARGHYKLLNSQEGQPFETGLQIELTNEKGDTLASLVVGGNVVTSGGASSGSFSGPAEQRFVRVPSDGDTVWEINDTVYELQALPQEWLDKSYLNVTGLKDVTITAPVLADSWAAQRKDEQSEFTLADPKVPGDALDTAKANGLGTLLSNATFTDVLTKDKVTPDFMKGAIGARLNTFDDFHYDLRLLEKKEPGASEAKYYFTSTVTADLPKERKAEPNEKPEDKKKNDDAFAAKKKTLDDKLAKEKTYNGWVYEVPNYTVTMLIKKRSEVLREKAPPPKINLSKPPSEPSAPPAAEPPAPTSEPAAPPAPAPKTEPATPKTDAVPSPASTTTSAPAPATAPTTTPPATSEPAAKPETKPAPDAPKPDAKPAAESPKPEEKPAPDAPKK